MIYTAPRRHFVDRLVNLRIFSSSLVNASDEKERNRIQSEIEKTTGEVDDALASMMSYVGYVSGAGSLGADRSYKLLKKMEKKKRR